MTDDVTDNAMDKAMGKTRFAVSRRTFVAGAAALPLLAGGAFPFAARASGGQVLLYDPSLSAGRRFAEHAGRLKGKAIALEGDRIRFMRSLLVGEPAALYGVTRHSDQLLVNEVAREAGYRAIALIQHRSDGGISPQCQPGAAAIATVAGIAGSRWPEAFAELAIGGVERCGTASGQGAVEPAMSWVLTRRS